MDCYISGEDYYVYAKDSFIYVKDYYIYTKDCYIYAKDLLCVIYNHDRFINAQASYTKLLCP